MPPEKKKLKKWTAPYMEQSINRYRIGSDIVQKIKLFSEANLEGLSSNSDRAWSAILARFGKELKYVCIENVDALRETWTDEILFATPLRNNLRGKDISNAELETLSHENMIWDMYLTVSKNPKRVTALAAVWNNESDKRLRQREFIRLCFQWMHEDSASQCVGYEPNYTATNMEKFCQFYSRFSGVFKKHDASAEQVCTLELWPTTLLACDQTNYEQILKGIHFTVKCGGLYHHLHQSAVTLICRLIRLYGGVLNVDSADVVQEVEIWISGIPQHGIHKCTLSYLIQAISQGKFSLDSKDHTDDKCIVPKYEDLVWVQKLPPNYPQSDVNQQISHKIKELEPTHLTKKTTVASEIDNGHKFVTISNPCCLGSQQMKQKIRQAYEKQKENALTDNLELYFLLELMFTVREHPDRLKVLETIWCQNDCLYLRHNHFIAISTAWAEESTDTPKIPAHTFEKFCNLSLRQVELASNRIPIPFNFDENPSFCDWYEKCINRFVVTDMQDKHPIPRQLESYQKQLLQQQLQLDEKIWFEYQTVFWPQKSNNDFKYPPHHHLPRKTFLHYFNILVPDYNSMLLYLIAKHFEYLIFLYGGDAKVVRKGELALGSYAIVLGDMAQRWMNEIDRLVFMSSFINDCIIAGKCEPRMSLLYAYDYNRRIPNQITDRESIIMSACIDVGREVSTTKDLCQKLLGNPEILKLVDDKAAFKRELRRKFCSYKTFTTIAPAWNTFMLLQHAMTQTGDVQNAFPLLRLFNYNDVDD